MLNWPTCRSQEDEDEEQNEYEADGFIVDDAEEEEEEEEERAVAPKRKKKKKRERELRLDDEDYDLLEENQVQVGGGEAKYQYERWGTLCVVGWMGVCALSLATRPMPAAISPYLSPTHWHAILSCQPMYPSTACLQGFRRPTGRKRLKSKADEARKATDAAGIQKELFGYEGAWRAPPGVGGGQGPPGMPLTVGLLLAVVHSAVRTVWCILEQYGVGQGAHGVCGPRLEAAGRSR